MIPARFRDELAGAIDQRFWPLEWVEARIADGTIVLIENETALIGVEKRIYPGGATELHGMFAVGALDGITELVGHVCAASDCDIAAIESRKGWARAFAPMGFTADKVRIVKELR